MEKNSCKISYKDKEYLCALELTLELVSGKWKSMVLWHLQDGTLRYGELRKKLGKITQKMLTQTLRDLEEENLLTRKVYPVVPPKVEYTITDRGMKLIPIFESLKDWGVELVQEETSQKKAV